MSSIKRKGMLVVISAPSGAGKTTIAEGLLSRDNKVQRSISVTTRAPREGEVDGEDYYFLNQEQFQEKLANNDFVEHAELFGNHYGTLRSTIDEAVEDGLDMLFVIGGQGNKQLQTLYSEDMVRIFVLPPSFKDLKSRLEFRRTESVDVVQTRLKKAATEIGFWEDYDYVVINKDIEPTIQAVHEIIKAERLKRHRRSELPVFVESLLKQGREYADNA